MVFFVEWRDSKQMASIIATVTVVLFLITFGVYVNFPQESHNAMIYLIMALTAGIVGVIDSYYERGQIVASNGFGVTKTQAITAFLVGVAVMYVVVSSKTLSLAAPLVVISDTTMMFFYVCVAAPLAEEGFFRMMGNPTMVLIFKNLKLPFYDVVGVVFSSVFFAVFHGAVYNWNYPAMFAAFVFGMFVSVGNQFFKSSGFGVGAHFINNAIMFAR